MRKNKKKFSSDFRFPFGENWLNFSNKLNHERIAFAKKSLQKTLGLSDLTGKKFLDMGCGSGLFSLAARQLGATVISVDYDIRSVKCTENLKKQYYLNDKDWEIYQGSILDVQFLSSLWKYDIVYSWGVLHHTGSMWDALENITFNLKPNGILLIAIYNRQNFFSPYWRVVKKIYNKSPRIFKKIMFYFYYLFFLIILFSCDLLKKKNPFDRYAGKGRRGMSIKNDVLDWIGGWPFEVASPEEIFNFYKDRGFSLEYLKTCGGKHGCNEYVFIKK